MVKKKALLKLVKERKDAQISDEDLEQIVLYSQELTDEDISWVFDKYPQLLEQAEKLCGSSSNDHTNERELSVCERIRQAGKQERRRINQERIIKVGKITLKAVVALGAGAFAIYKLAQSLPDNELSDTRNDDDETGFRDASGKRWNAEKDRWEIDGEPISYRVSWKNIDEPGEFERIFTDVDQAYDFYQSKRKSYGSYGATYEHLDY